MNGSSAFAKELLTALVDALSPNGPAVAVFPPTLYLRDVRDAIGGADIAVGVQNVHTETSGAFTGEVAAEMAADSGATVALVGHSERRELFGETDADVAAKFAAVLRAGMIPVLCIGERLEQREAGQAEATVLAQLTAVLDAAGADAFSDAVVAYEPVWAIGTGRTATPEDAQTMHAAIRRHVAAADAGVAQRLRILYGGSVNAGNAATLFAQPDVDGGLVGGASLDAEQFIKIYQAAREARADNEAGA